MMQVLSPPWFPNNFVWPILVEDHENMAATHDLYDPGINDYKHSTSGAALAQSSSQESDIPTGLELADSGGCSNPSAKKINHNANERDRRKRLNTLYSSLRSLLPLKDQSKKMSIPTTVSLVLKYIPELQKEVERLVRKKEEVLSKKPSTNFNSQEQQADVRGRRGQPWMVSSYPTIVATKVDEREVVVQICALATCPLSKLLLLLEEDGFRVINASVFAALGHRVFYNLHLYQAAKEAVDMECGMLSEKLVSAYCHSQLV